MNRLFCAALVAGLLGFVGCDDMNVNNTPAEREADRVESQAEREADRIRDQGQVEADRTREQAGDTNVFGQSRSQAVESEADAIENQAERDAERIEERADDKAETIREIEEEREDLRDDDFNRPLNP
jgi:regulator of protease activity HflC (stomatin/prohibitin superfamily)